MRKYVWFRYKSILKNSKLPWKNLTNDGNADADLKKAINNLLTFNVNDVTSLDDNSVIFKNYSEHLTGLMAAVNFGANFNNKPRGLKVTKIDLMANRHDG